MTLQPPAIIAITGIMTAFDAEIGYALANRLEPTAFVYPPKQYVLVSEDDRHQPTARDYVDLRWRVAAMHLKSLCASGTTAIYQDLLLSSLFEAVTALLMAYPLYLVVLNPAPGMTDPAASVKHWGWTVKDLEDEVRNQLPRRGLWLNAGNWTVEQTVDAILERISEAKI